MRRDCKNIRCADYSTNHQYNCMCFIYPSKDCIDFMETVYKFDRDKEREQIALLFSGEYDTLTCKEFREMLEEKDNV